MADSSRGRALTIFAVLFAILAVSNLLKPFQLEGPDTGFVLFGVRLAGAANTIVGPLFGLFLLAYAGAIWGMRRVAMPMAHAYATYVIINLISFSLWGPKPAESGIGYTLFGIVYAIVAIGVSLGCAIMLTKRKAELA